MKPYRVILEGASAVKIDHARWVADHFELDVLDKIAPPKDGRDKRHVGFIYRCDVKSSDVFNAMADAAFITRKISDELAVFHRAAIAIPRVKFALSMDDGDRREFAQVFDMSTLFVPKRVHDKTLFGRVGDAFEKLGHSRPRDLKRLDRAMHYLRSSYLEIDPIDCFEDAWKALEALTEAYRVRRRASYVSQATLACSL